MALLAQSKGGALGFPLNSSLPSLRQILGRDREAFRKVFDPEWMEPFAGENLPDAANAFVHVLFPADGSGKERDVGLLPFRMLPEQTRDGMGVHLEQIRRITEAELSHDFGWNLGAELAEAVGGSDGLDRWHGWVQLKKNSFVPLG
jgi:hypothetical protein